MEKAVFGAGCFWGVEVTFEKIEGVESTRVGFMGGHLAEPTYKQVKTGVTGHAEVVEVIFDSKAVSYEELLEVFFACHNPTTRNRQGEDVGNQYRSIIFCYNKEQIDAAEKKKKELAEQEVFKKDIVTEITTAKDFYEAEEYHQKYAQKNGSIACGI